MDVLQVTQTHTKRIQKVRQLAHTCLKMTISQIVNNQMTQEKKPMNVFVEKILS